MLEHLISDKTSSLGSDADEELAGDVDPVCRFELAELTFNFRPSLFTFGFAQLFDRSSKYGSFLQPSDRLRGGGEMTMNAYRSDGDIAQAALSKSVLEYIGFAEGEQWQRCASETVSDTQRDALIRIFFRR